MMDLTRQKDLVDERIFSTPINIIGAGAIGSFTTLALAKMGFKDIMVFDDDKVEEHNIPNQFYPLSSIGKSKVCALKELVLEMTGIGILPIESRWDKSMIFSSSTPAPVIVVSAVDTMKVRSELYTALCTTHNIFIDGRMGGHQLEVRTCYMRLIYDKSKYKKTLWSDSQTSPLPCTQKAVMYNVLMIASLIANQCRLTLENKVYNREIIYDFETGIMLSSNECMKVKQE
jgi:hypothetical protein